MQILATLKAIDAASKIETPKCVKGRQVMTLKEREIHFHYCRHHECVRLRALYDQVRQYVKDNIDKECK